MTRRKKEKPPEPVRETTATADDRIAARVEEALEAVRVAYEQHRRRRDTAADDAEGLAIYQANQPLWTPRMAAALPPLSEVEARDDPTCFYRFYTPTGSTCDWYVMAAKALDTGDVRFLVYADLGDPQFAEVGDVLLSELRSVRLPFWLNIELDRYFRPKPLSAVRRSQ